MVVAVGKRLVGRAADLIELLLDQRPNGIVDDVGHLVLGKRFEALAHLKSYHRTPALIRKGDRLFHTDRNLLLYYQNRLDGFGLPMMEKPQ